MTPVTVKKGGAAIVLGLPHTGTVMSDDVACHLNANGRALADTDWHIDRLYADLLPDATMVTANFHRYIIDANRDPAGRTLYPGQNTTTLVPLSDFDGTDIWNRPPDAAEIARRTQAFHAPYHAALHNELKRVRELHGYAILYDCHSIRSDIPFLFDGTLPDFNIGTATGTTCAPEIETITAAICKDAQGYTSILNGRFKGGWTTRHYGQPAQGVHAIQMELAQSTYLQTEASPWAYDPEKAMSLRRILTSILEALTDLGPHLGVSK